MNSSSSSNDDNNNVISLIYDNEIIDELQIPYKCEGGDIFFNYTGDEYIVLPLEFKICFMEWLDLIKEGISNYNGDDYVALPPKLDKYLKDMHVEALRNMEIKKEIVKMKMQLNDFLKQQTHLSKKEIDQWKKDVCDRNPGFGSF